MQCRHVSARLGLNFHLDAVFLRAHDALGLQHLTHCTVHEVTSTPYMCATCEKWLELGDGV